VSGSPTTPPPARPFPQHTAYAGAAILPSGTAETRDRAVTDAYDAWKETWLVGEDGGRCRVLLDFSRGAETVSEGQGYGMVIVATLAGHDPHAKGIFDGLWAFAQDHPSEIDGRLMDWSVPPDGSAEPGDDDSAFDGDADIAYALLLADAQWGGYRADAEVVLAGLVESALGPDSALPLLGDWVDPDGARYDQWTVRTSDFMPDHFRAFAAVTGDARWTDAVDAVLDADEALADPSTGLLPDFAVPVSDTDHHLVPAPPDLLEGEWDGAYSYNAGRDPWRLGLDALLHDEPRSRELAVRISQWAEADTGGHPRALAPGYALDGTPIPPGDYFTSFFAAPIGVAAMSDPDAQDWLDGIWGAVEGAREGYYEDTVTLQSLIAMSGNAWSP
jgi:hypothetical protein